MVSYPQIRERLFTHLKMLADKEKQIESWVNHNYPTGVEYDCLQFTLDFLFDDTGLGENRGIHQIGWVIKDKNELYSIQKVTKAIELTVDAVGNHKDNIEYISHPLWNEVIKTAKEALNSLK